VNLLCIAGFLGSGKTTVLLEVARAMAKTGAQLAVIENEFGLLAVQSRYEPDWVIVEPTGLAAPGDILGVVVDHCPDVDHIRVLSIADAERWPMLLEIVEPLVTAQLAAADVVAVNKIDAVGEDELAAVLDSVRGLAPRASVLAVSATTGAGMRRLLGAVV